MSRSCTKSDDIRNCYGSASSAANFSPLIGGGCGHDAEHIFWNTRSLAATVLTVYYQYKYIQEQCIIYIMYAA